MSVKRVISRFLPFAPRTDMTGKTSKELFVRHFLRMATEIAALAYAQCAVYNGNSTDISNEAVYALTYPIGTVLPDRGNNFHDSPVA